MAGGAVAPGGSSGNPLKTGFIKREYLWAFSLVTSLFFLWGFAYGLLDVLNAHFRSVLNITKTQSTGLQIAYFGIGYFAFSPVAGEILRRRGYKFTIIMGLCFYSLGAILFWPVAKFSGRGNNGAIFAGFVVCTGVIACGLATLEVAANSYISVMPPHNVANFRLQFSQAFNGVGSFAGPLIASKYFFSGEHSGDLGTVQYVYMAVAGMGVAVAIAFFFTKLPEVSEEALQAEAEALAMAHGADPQTEKGFWKQYRALSGALAQFLYVGAQVTIGAFFLFLADDAGIPHDEGAKLLSYGLIIFTVARFIGTALLSVVAAPVLLGIYAVACTIICIMIGAINGKGGVYCAMVIMFFESIMYPVIFVLSTSGLGRHTRRASAMVVMGVSGGAVFPPIQGAISDAFNTRVSFFICVPCFVYIALWSVYIWHKDGRRWGVAANDEIEREIEAASGGAIPPAHVGLNYTGHNDKYESAETKEDFERVEKA